MTPRGWLFLLGALFAVLAETSWGQKASNWRVYKMTDGLAESATASVTITPRGRVLARHLHLASISELDGYTNSVLPAPDKSEGRVYESPAGRLWVVSPEGLQEFRDGGWILHPVKEIAAEFHAGLPPSAQPIPLCPIEEERVLFLLPGRLMEFDAGNPEQPQTRLLGTATQTQLGRFSSMGLARDGGLWISGARGLAKVPAPLQLLKPTHDWQQFIPPASLQIQNFLEPHEDLDGGVTAVAESSRGGQKSVIHFDGQRWTVEWTGTEKIFQAWRGPDNTRWAATEDALFQLEEGRSELVESEEIVPRKYLDLAIEPHGAFWLATADGLYRYGLPLWRTPRGVEKINSPVRCVAEDAEGRLWFVAGGDLHRLQGDLHDAFPLPQILARTAPIPRALFPLKNGSLLLDTGEGLLQCEPRTGEARRVPSQEGGRRLRALGLLRDGSVCLQSSNSSLSEPGFRLELYDGTQFQPGPDPPPGRFLAGGLSALFATQNGDLWLGGDEGVAWYHERKWQTFSSADKTGPQAALGFEELVDGRIWCATPDTIWEFNGRSWSAAWPWLDRVNALLRSHDGTFWVASNSGLHRFLRGAWVENGTEDGLPSATVRELFEDHRGRLWAATARGLSYHPGAEDPDADRDPPRTFLQKLSEKGNNFPEETTLTLTFNGQDKWKSTHRSRLLFAYRLDERDWSLFQEANTVSFNDLPAGPHVFQVRAMDRNCNVDAAPTRLEFAVVVPWYKEARLVVISLAGLAVALFFAALAFNRHRQLLNSYAEVEQKVAQRTRELEIANRALLHSQKMNALGTLAAGIAHDFNNILSIIKGSAQIIEDNLDNPQKLRTRVDRIKTVVEQGAGIVKAMLGFSRVSDDRLSPCDLNAIVDDTLKMLGDRFPREVEVGFERAPDLPQVPGFRDFIQQILLNLIFNAAESMSKRKQVVLTTRVLQRLPADLLLMPAPAASHVAISVRDFGCGISPENLPRIFEPFFTTKAFSARRGTGLGLTMVYELARRMEAGLAVESVLNEGSTFTLILPVRALPADSESPG